MEQCEADDLLTLIAKTRVDIDDVEKKRRMKRDRKKELQDLKEKIEDLVKQCVNVGLRPTVREKVSNLSLPEDSVLLLKEIFEGDIENCRR